MTNAAAAAAGDVLDVLVNRNGLKLYVLTPERLSFIDLGPWVPTPFASTPASPLYDVSAASDGRRFRGLALAA